MLPCRMRQLKEASESSGEKDRRIVDGVFAEVEMVAHEDWVAFARPQDDFIDEVVPFVQDPPVRDDRFWVLGTDREKDRRQRRLTIKEISHGVRLVSEEEKPDWRLLRVGDFEPPSIPRRVPVTQEAEGRRIGITLIESVPSERADLPAQTIGEVPRNLHPRVVTLRLSSQERPVNEVSGIAWLSHRPHGSFYGGREEVVQRQDVAVVAGRKRVDVLTSIPAGTDYQRRIAALRKSQVAEEPSKSAVPISEGMDVRKPRMDNRGIQYGIGRPASPPGSKLGHGKFDFEGVEGRVLASGDFVDSGLVATRFIRASQDHAVKTTDFILARWVLVLSPLICDEVCAVKGPMPP